MNNSYKKRHFILIDFYYIMKLEIIHKLEMKIVRRNFFSIVFLNNFKKKKKRDNTLDEAII